MLITRVQVSKRLESKDLLMKDLGNARLTPLQKLQSLSVQVLGYLALPRRRALHQSRPLNTSHHRRCYLLSQYHLRFF